MSVPLDNTTALRVPYGPLATLPSPKDIGDKGLYVNPEDGQAIYQVQSGNWKRLAVPKLTVVGRAVNYTIPASNCLVIVVTANRTITLPTAVGNAGTQCIVKNSAAGHPTTIAAQGGQTIDGSATLLLAQPLAVARLMSDGANWWVV